MRCTWWAPTPSMSAPSDTGARGKAAPVSGVDVAGSTAEPHGSDPFAEYLPRDRIAVGEVGEVGEIEAIASCCLVERGRPGDRRRADAPA